MPRASSSQAAAVSAWIAPADDGRRPVPEAGAAAAGVPGEVEADAVLGRKARALADQDDDGFGGHGFADVVAQCHAGLQGDDDGPEGGGEGSEEGRRLGVEKALEG